MTKQDWLKDAREYLHEEEADNLDIYDTDTEQGYANNLIIHAIKLLSI